MDHDEFFFYFILLYFLLVMGRYKNEKYDAIYGLVILDMLEMFCNVLIYVIVLGGVK